MKVAKTQLMDFSHHDESVVIDGDPICSSRYVKYLGITIEENLSFSMLAVELKNLERWFQLYLV